MMCVNIHNLFWVHSLNVSNNTIIEDEKKMKKKMAYTRMLNEGNMYVHTVRHVVSRLPTIQINDVDDYYYNVYCYVQ